MLFRSGGPDEVSHAVLDQDEANEDLAGRVLPVDGVAEMVSAAVFTEQLYLLPHGEARTAVQRRFQRIERAFEKSL